MGRAPAVDFYLLAYPS